MNKILSNLLKFYVLFLLVVIAYVQIFKVQNCLNRAGVVCVDQICTVSNTSLTGYVFEKFSFSQTAFKNMKLKKVDGRYRVYGNFVILDECVSCNEKGTTVLPLSWRRKANVKEFLAQAVSENDFEYIQYGKMLFEFVILLQVATVFAVVFCIIIR